jgi:predicted 3-demethylubiquinone-9 3-methyltransferase (glyoxalase superfamily)
MKGITTFLWFDTAAEEAANFYVTTFANSKITNVARYGDAGPRPKGMVMTVQFEIQGHKFVALNGGSEYHFTPAISFLANCETQKELDELWEKLLPGGEVLACGWINDKYGVSWQITPVALLEMIHDPNPAKSQAVMRAMMQMKKLDLAVLKEAYDRAK